MSVIRKASRKSLKADCAANHQSVLIIEDQRSLALLMKGMIEENYAARVDLAASLSEAKSLLEENSNYFVAVTDLNLPDADYEEILDTLAERNIPAIAITGEFGDDMREKVLKKGVVDYVLKESINAYGYVSELVCRLAKNLVTKLLVVDDAAAIRSMLSAYLEMYGFEVFQATNGKEALELLNREQTIKVVVTDYNMPEMDGFSLTVEARKKFGKNKLAIIGISSSDDHMISARFLKNGANDFIVKPFNFEEVICRVNQNLDLLDMIEEAQDAANLDFLTKIFNRRYFFVEGEKLLAKNIKSDTLSAVAMLDLDHFKSINDTHGHDVGDIVLIAVAKLLNEYFNDHLPARLGGEEFAVLLSGVEVDDVVMKLEKFREAVETLEFEEVPGLTVSTSIGLCTEKRGDLDYLLNEADKKLYQAKQAGRNQLVA